MRIIRHSIAITDYQTIKLPGEGQPLSVALSRNLPDHAIDLWSLDEQIGDPRAVGVYVVNPMPDTLATHLSWLPHNPRSLIPPTLTKFIGTVVTPSGLVWHVFDGPVQ